ncbi:MAG TPA: D-hexose-6-phosphate mutarotase [Phycisphaerae bacterium]|nr:D-hexose-6-phosphate mutarotase [Phycisphaerae bacterium]
MSHLASVISGNGGLQAVRVQAPAGAGLVYLHGAHVAQWIPTGADEVLWLSAKSQWTPDKPIRGGVPICFPWFGPRQGDPSAPAHGFARLKQWTLESTAPGPDGAGVVSLRLDADDDTRRWWPHEFSLRLRVAFGATLDMRLELENRGTSSLQAEQALHTYFAVGDVRQVAIHGLDGVTYIDKTDAMKEKLQQGPIRITAETDRVYTRTAAAVTIEDPSWTGTHAQGRRILIARENSADAVVWNPWIAKAKAMPDFGDDEWPGMLCVETCNVKDQAVRLNPGEARALTARIHLERL